MTPATQSPMTLRLPEEDAPFAPDWAGLSHGRLAFRRRREPADIDRFGDPVDQATGADL